MATELKIKRIVAGAGIAIDASDNAQLVISSGGGGALSTPIEYSGTINSNKIIEITQAGSGANSCALRCSGGEYAIVGTGGSVGGVRGVSNIDSSTVMTAVIGKIENNTNIASAGVYGLNTNAAAGYGVSGKGFVGVYGYSDVAGGGGVMGYSANDTGYGGYFKGTEWGLRAEATKTNTATGSDLMLSGDGMILMRNSRTTEPTSVPAGYARLYFDGQNLYFFSDTKKFLVTKLEV
jgi:hypothetical protein